MSSIHVHIPYRLYTDYIGYIDKHKINPEIMIAGDDLDNFTSGELENLKEHTRNIPSCSIHAPYMDLSPGAVDSEIRRVTEKRFLDTCDIALATGAGTIVFHSGFEKWKYGLKKDIWLKQSLITWEKVLNHTASSGLKIAIENIFEDEPANLVDLAGRVASERFGICFDTGHFNLFSSISLTDWLTQIESYLFEVHLHDNYGAVDEHNPIGQGSFPFRDFFREMNGGEYVYTIENGSKEKALQSLQALEAFIPEFVLK